MEELKQLRQRVAELEQAETERKQAEEELHTHMAGFTVRKESSVCKIGREDLAEKHSRLLEMRGN